MSTHITRIPHSTVLAALDIPNQREFNTCLHPTAELPASYPSATSDDERPFSYTRWARLILSTRPPTRLQTIHLPARAVRILLDAAEIGIHTGKIPASSAEDIADQVLPLFDVEWEDGQFMRLDDCSPKDGASDDEGKGRAVTSARGAVLRLVTSLRARSSLLKSTTANVHFVDWDDRMRSEDEYRVFCPPAGVAGVSQYAWFARWKYADAEEAEQREVVGEIVGGVRRIYGLILCEMRDNPHPRDRELLERGLTFDVLFDSPRVELVELNPFGADRNTGSCLFHWVRDHEALWDTSQVEFRVAV